MVERKVGRSDGLTAKYETKQNFWNTKHDTTLLARCLGMPSTFEDYLCNLRVFVRTHFILAPGTCGWVGLSGRAYVVSGSCGGLQLAAPGKFQELDI